MEKLDLRSLIESVISDLSNNADINDYALKTKLIARQLNNDKFSKWVNDELEGYKDINELPKYRVIENVPVIATVVIENGFHVCTMKNHVMPLSEIGDIGKIKQISTINLRDSVLTLQEYANTYKDGINIYLNEWERLDIQDIYKNSTILKAYKPINRTNLLDIIYRFKSNLLDMFMEFDEKIFNHEIDFDIMATKREIEKVVNQTINTGIYLADNSSAKIEDNQIITGNDNNITFNSAQKKELEKILSAIENLSKEVDEDREDIADEVAKIRVELDKKHQRPKFIKSALNSIKGIAQGVAVEISKEKLIELVDKGIGLLGN